MTTALYIRKVLVVATDAGLVQIVGLSLRDVGRWIPLGATGADEALAVCAREQPQVILVDAALPEGPGGPVLRALRAQAAIRSTPIVMLVDGDEPLRKAMQRYVPLGACGVIRKPVSPLELPGQIRALTHAQSGASPEVLFRGK